MASVLILVVLVLVLFDAKLLRVQAQDVFQEAFSLTRTEIFGLVGGTFILSALTLGKVQSPFSVIVLIVMPVYLFRRFRYLDRLKNSAERPIALGHPLQLMSDLYGVVILWFYSVFVFAIVYRAVNDLVFKSTSILGELLLSAVFSSGLLMALVYQASQKFSDKGFKVNVGLSLNGLSKVKTLLVPALGGAAFSMFAAYLLWIRKVQPSTPLSQALESNQSVPLIFFFIVLALCVAPLIEEIIFRGYFLHVLRLVKGDRFAILFIAFTFAVLHVGQYWGDWLAIAVVAVLGLSLTYLRVWAKTTVASVVMHYVYNTGVTIIPVLLLIASNPAYFKYKAYYAVYDDSAKQELLLESIRKQPDFVEAYNELAWLYAQKGVELERALELIDKALSAEPQNPAYLDTKAEILTKLGRVDESLSIRNELIERDFLVDYEIEKVNEIEQPGEGPVN